MKQWIYHFSEELTDGGREQKNLLGGKGANLAEMCRLGLRVPPGFTISTEACMEFYRLQGEFPENLWQGVLSALTHLERFSGKKFGHSSNPLLFSVRSGARVSMPGMMDTVLNLGLNDESVLGLAAGTQNERFAYDSYRRFIQMYSNVVLGMNVSLLEASLEDLKEARQCHSDTDLTVGDLKELIHVYKDIILQELGRSFPQDPHEQLREAIKAVFNSWNNMRAVKYRELHGYAHDWGTAVNIQSMVFGNMGEDSATGVAFTRNPSTGEKKFFGEYLVNAQGEDVVAGIRTPRPINKESRTSSTQDANLQTLEDIMPETYKELVNVYKKLEQHYCDMQDIEFTIEKGKLYLLQTRNGKRTTKAALKILIDLVAEKLITKEEAIMRLRPEDLNQLLHPQIDQQVKKVVLGVGLPASPGAASGRIALSAVEAERIASTGVKSLLVRVETSPDDIAGMVSAQGILTSRGGMTSHAAVVARGMGKPCVVGMQNLIIDYATSTVRVGDKTFKEGDVVTIDGGSGELFEGEIAVVEATITEEFRQFMLWVDSVRTMRVRTNADNVQDAEMALRFGAEGIGLCRTEHMFFDPERILAVREMIFADTSAGREKALKKILPFQREDFEKIFSVMSGHPVNIRLLDPPLHEFLPYHINEKEQLADYLKVDIKLIEERIKFLHEMNPMLGHRGCRLAITFPEIYEMQVEAIVNAAVHVAKKGKKVISEIMIPLVIDAEELKQLRDLVEGVLKRLNPPKDLPCEFKIGTMIETPRAAIMAGEVAEYADFFSFGTNDLTQTTLGISRDDAGKFLPDYIGRGIFAEDPFVSIDQLGVGYLVRLATIEGRKKNSHLHVGICGEHGGDSKSVEFFFREKLDYVSCSPYRVPIARLALAQGELKRRKNG